MLQSNWDKYGKLKLLKNDGLVLICKAVERQLSHSQENIEAFSLLISVTLKVLCLCKRNVKTKENDLHNENFRFLDAAVYISDVIYLFPDV